MSVYVQRLDRCHTLGRPSLVTWAWASRDGVPLPRLLRWDLVVAQRLQLALVVLVCRPLELLNHLFHVVDLAGWNIEG